ncbi:hypothetical protein J6590_064270, partial [Homalodisca vitripennis]
GNPVNRRQAIVDVRDTERKSGSVQRAELYGRRITTVESFRCSRQERIMRIAERCSVTLLACYGMLSTGGR